MNAFEMLSVYLGVIAGVILVLFFVYKLFRLLSSRAGGYLLKENGRFVQECFVRFNPATNSYQGYDLHKNMADRLTGEIFVDTDGKAWVQVQRESRNGYEVLFEKIGYIDLKGNVYDNIH